MTADHLNGLQFLYNEMNYKKSSPYVDSMLICRS